TVNRWPHGYGYVANSLYDEDDYDGVLERARQKSSRVAIANSDAGGGAYANLAIDQAARAVRGLIGGGGFALARRLLVPAHIKKAADGHRSCGNRRRDGSVFAWRRHEWRPPRSR